MIDSLFTPLTADVSWQRAPPPTEKEKDDNTEQHGESAAENSPRIIPQPPPIGSAQAKTQLTMDNFTKKHKPPPSPIISSSTRSTLTNDNSSPRSQSSGSPSTSNVSPPPSPVGSPPPTFPLHATTTTTTSSSSSSSSDYIVATPRDSPSSHSSPESVLGADSFHSLHTSPSDSSEQVSDEVNTSRRPDSNDSNQDVLSQERRTTNLFRSFLASKKKKKNAVEMSTGLLYGSLPTTEELIGRRFTEQQQSALGGAQRKTSSADSLDAADTSISTAHSSSKKATVRSDRKKKKRARKKETAAERRPLMESEDNLTESQEPASPTETKLPFTFRFLQPSVYQPKPTIDSDSLFSITNTKAAMEHESEMPHPQSDFVTLTEVSEKVIKEKVKMSLEDLLQILTKMIAEEETGQHTAPIVVSEDEDLASDLIEEENKAIGDEYEEDELRYVVSERLIETRRMRRQREKKERKKTPITDAPQTVIDLEQVIVADTTQVAEGKKKKKKKRTLKKSLRSLRAFQPWRPARGSIRMEPLHLSAASDETETEDAYNEFFKRTFLHVNHFTSYESAKDYCTQLLGFIEHSKWYDTIVTAFEHHLERILREEDHLAFSEGLLAQFKGFLLNTKQSTVIPHLDLFLRELAVKGKEGRRYSAIIRQLVYSPCSEASVERLFSRIRFLVGKQRVSLQMRMLLASLYVASMIAREKKEEKDEEQQQENPQ